MPNPSHICWRDIHNITELEEITIRQAMTAPIMDTIILVRARLSAFTIEVHHHKVL